MRLVGEVRVGDKEVSRRVETVGLVNCRWRRCWVEEEELKERRERRLELTRNQERGLQNRESQWRSLGEVHLKEERKLRRLRLYLCRKQR